MEKWRVEEFYIRKIKKIKIMRAACRPIIIRGKKEKKKKKITISKSMKSPTSLNKNKKKTTRKLWRFLYTVLKIYKFENR